MNKSLLYLLLTGCSYFNVSLASNTTNSVKPILDKHIANHDDINQHIIDYVGFEEATHSACSNIIKLIKLKDSYKDLIKEVTDEYVLLKNGTKIDSKLLLDQMSSIYIPGKPQDVSKYLPTSDAGRTRCEEFFKAIYGDNKTSVIKNLAKVKWLKGTFGNKCRTLEVNKVNDCHLKLEKVSNELDKLIAKTPYYKEYLRNSGGTFCWRKIDNSNKLSPHSWAIAMNINELKGDSWQKDLKNLNLPVSEETSLTCKDKSLYKNQIPYEIVLIFEKYGYIWGGKWKHYSTTVFEYRPELFPDSFQIEEVPTITMSQPSSSNTKNNGSK